MQWKKKYLDETYLLQFHDDGDDAHGVDALARAHARVHDHCRNHCRSLPAPDPTPPLVLLEALAQSGSSLPCGDDHGDGHGGGRDHIPMRLQW